jgi:phosphatidylethanolamine-binding protein (PEBP) family uncharacterized protein
MKHFRKLLPGVAVGACSAILIAVLPNCAASSSAPDAGGAVDSGDSAASVNDAMALDGALRTFALKGATFAGGGLLPLSSTCDGAGASPALEWSGAPATTTEYALLMTTVAPEGTKWNWVVYGIPGTTAALSEASLGVGKNGITSDGPNLTYSAPCSQGPGAKIYTFTLYALSGAPTLPADSRQVTGAVLAAASSGKTLATATFSVSYTRK